ncbi:MAG TPA: polysaccharide deacetylase family protein [Alphaproteobacteria bacterium]|nr:polysaccharide deacetylase family protein [Alphaproteobacteria bacterium]HJN61376.1 polysaccharide deacetylase family protein [Alphaproteobacteria bacterium]
MSDWRALDEELRALAGAGRRAGLWWRDDDAAEDSPALARLLDLAGGAAPAPLLAVIPAMLSEAAAARIDGSTGAGAELRIAQHGYAHANHARDNEKKIELGGSQPVHECIAQLRAGSALLSERFAKRFLPLLVPPWNRIAPALIARLPALGYAALSTYGGRAAALPVNGLKRVNCHIDILDWRAGAAFLGEAEALRLACQQLAARRLGDGDADEPIGLLSHHLRHDEAAWRFLAEFFARTQAHPGAHWIAPADLLAAA